MSWITTYRYTDTQWNRISPHAPPIPIDELNEIEESEFNSIRNSYHDGNYSEMHINIHDPYGEHDDMWRTIYVK